MNVAAFIIAIVAIACFLVAAVQPPHIWLLPVGLAVLVLSWMVALTTTGTLVHL